MHSICCSRRRPDDFHLLVIGDGPQRDELAAIASSERRHVSWIQYCTDSADLARYYRAADLFVHPGVQETFGLVALESQACGTPVVGIRGSYMDRIIFHEQEIWARENTPEALADAIEESSAKTLSCPGQNAAAGRRDALQLAAGLRATLLHLSRGLRKLPTIPDGIRPSEAIYHSQLPRRPTAKRCAQLCCQTGFLGEPIDPVYEDRELFADFLTTYYTDWEPESSFVLEMRRRDLRLPARLAQAVPAISSTRSGRTSRSSSGRSAATFATTSGRAALFAGRWCMAGAKCRPRRDASRIFTSISCRDARKMSTTRALMSAYLSYLYRCGRKRVYGQIVTFESRRGEKMFERYGFKVMNRAEITKYKAFYPESVYLSTVVKNLETAEPLSVTSRSRS